MTEALRHKVERFDRFQRQFARARRRRRRDEFQRTLDALLTRVQSPPPPPPSPVSPPHDLSPGQEEYDQEMRDLLFRVASQERPLFPYSLAPRTGDWWSPTPIYGFRVWQLIGGVWHGARVPWTKPSLKAMCLHPTTDPTAPLPHDVAACRQPPCGIYATKSPNPLRAMIRPWFGDERVILGLGVVALTGRVIEHDRGYRAEQAEVVALAVLSGDRDVGEMTWVDAPRDLASLFTGPDLFLTTAPSRVDTTPETMDRAFTRVAALATGLSQG